jgi:hypothetical protein
LLQGKLVLRKIMFDFSWQEEREKGTVEEDKGKK